MTEAAGTVESAQSRYTRCPGCSTVFRVTAAQLALREGQVRCGHCRAVFDANDHFVSLDAGPPPDEIDPSDEMMLSQSAEGKGDVPADTAAPEETRAEEAPIEKAEATTEEATTDEAATEEATTDEAATEEVATEEATRVETKTEEAATGEEATAEEATEAEATEAEATEAEATKNTAAEEAVAEDGAAPETGIDETAVARTPDQEATVEVVAGQQPATAATPIDESAAERAGIDGDAAATPIDESAAERAGIDGDAGATPVDESAAAIETDAAEGEPAAQRDEPASLAPADLGGAQRFEWKKRPPAESSRRVLAALAVLFVVGLASQAIFEYRDVLAARVPATRPLLEAACSLLSCSVEPLRDSGALSIDASDLQADPAHRGLLVLSATVRNRAAHPIAYPYLELTLTDSSDRIVARRAFAPSEYAGGTADLHRGIAANGERLVRMFLDASATQQAGYRLYLFYP